MSDQASLLRAYTFIRKQRIRKKRRIRQMALGVMVDKTIAVYLLIVGGYIFASIFMLSDFLASIQEWITFVEEVGRERFWLISAILPIRYVNQAFTKPGIIFSGSEFQLSILPFKRRSIWFLSALSQWFKQLMMLGFSGAVIVLLTGLSVDIVLAYIGLFMVYNVVMTIPQWQLFQMHIIKKIGAVACLVGINAVGLWISPAAVGVILLIGIATLNIVWSKHLFHNVDWKKVTEASDFAVWSMQLVSRASNVQMKQNKMYSVFEKVKLFKKPLPYGELGIYRRLWLLYLGKNYQLLLKLVGGVLLLMFFTLYLGSQFFHVGVALTIYIYSQSAAALFIDRFHTDIVQILPWALADYKKAFFEWMLYISIPFVLPISLYAALNMSLWLPAVLLLYGSVFVYSLEVVLSKTVTITGNENAVYQRKEAAMTAGLVCVGMTGYFPFLSLSFVLFGWLFFRESKK